MPYTETLDIQFKIITSNGLYQKKKKTPDATDYSEENYIIGKRKKHLTPNSTNFILTSNYGNLHYLDNFFFPQEFQLHTYSFFYNL